MENKTKKKKKRKNNWVGNKSKYIHQGWKPEEIKRKEQEKVYKVIQEGNRCGEQRKNIRDNLPPDKYDMDSVFNDDKKGLHTLTNLIICEHNVNDVKCLHSLTMKKTLYTLTILKCLLALTFAGISTYINNSKMHLPFKGIKTKNLYTLTTLKWRLEVYNRGKTNISLVPF